MVPPQSAVICHHEAHIETAEGGAPGFFTHGAKLMLAEGEGAKLTPAAIRGVLDPIADGVHWVKPAAVSITQATELGRVYTPGEVLEMLSELRGARLLDGYRGTPAIDRQAAAEAVARIGDAALALGPALASLEVNPLRATATGAETLDALAVWTEEH